MVVVHVASRNARSWLTTRTAPRKPASHRSRHATVARAGGLVGAGGRGAMGGGRRGGGVVLGAGLGAGGAGGSPAASENVTPSKSVSPAYPNRRSATWRTVMANAPVLARLLYGGAERGERLARRRSLGGRLAQERLDARHPQERLVEPRVGALRVRAERDEIALGLVHRDERAQPRRRGPVIGRDDAVHHARERRADIDRGIAPARRDRAVEDDVPVEDAAHLVGHGLVEVAPLDEDGVDGGDAAVGALAGSLEEARQRGEGARRIPAPRRSLTRGEAHLPRRPGEARGRVDEEQHARAAVAEALGGRRRDLRRPPARR